MYTLEDNKNQEEEELENGRKTAEFSPTKMSPVSKGGRRLVAKRKNTRDSFNHTNLNCSPTINLPMSARKMGSATPDIISPLSTLQLLH